MDTDASADGREGYWAALDLGSNSFHLLLVRRAGASFVVVERLKEKVQLLGGFREGQINDDALQRGWNCLARFAQRLKSIPPERVFAMGTCALRQADNADVFAAGANRVLPAPLEIISGEREAALIYAAVSHHLGGATAPRLVVDIGGGSTEIAVDETAGAAGPEVPPGRACVSVELGCVAFKDRFFAAGMSLPEAYEAARKAAVAELRGSLDPSFVRSCHGGGRAVIGTSGTIESIQAVLRANGWSADDITLDGLMALEQAMNADAWLIDAGLPGLAPDRIDIFPAGVAILSACFEVLQLREMGFVDVTLLQGIICEHLAALSASPTRSGTEADTVLAPDLRVDSVEQLAARFGVDDAQAQRVQRTVLALFEQSALDLGLDEDDRRLLIWAARLHEVGTHVNARHYHRHGGYIIKHTEMPGFTETEQAMLALLVRGHRRSMPGLAFHAFDPQLSERLLKIVVLLRLAVILERSHADAESAAVALQVDGQRLLLDCGPQWLQTHPLSHKELQVEIGQLATAGYTLELAPG